MCKGSPPTPPHSCQSLLCFVFAMTVILAGMRYSLKWFWFLKTIDIVFHVFLGHLCFNLRIVAHLGGSLLLCFTLSVLFIWGLSSCRIQSCQLPVQSLVGCVFSLVDVFFVGKGLLNWYNPIFSSCYFLNNWGLREFLTLTVFWSIFHKWLQICSMLDWCLYG